ncbi:hypothetical protein GCM10009560_62150 [Nonomuraea longicatena]|uniref:Uncharacterized protein n=1 Tax=Nonomuraea longicatena TaxID=83682 RepID=A0ABP4BA43_9ACTN
MALRLLGGPSGVNGSPRLYEDGTDYIVQGYPVEDGALLEELAVPDGEIVVRIPKTLAKFFPEARSGGTDT